MAKHGEMHQAEVSGFDRKPESALIGIAMVTAVTSRSRATIYRWIERGQFPKPKKIGGSQNLWSVGEIRAALASAH